MRRGFRRLLLELVAVVTSVVVFGLPLSYVLTNVGKDPAGAAEMRLAPEAKMQYAANFAAVIQQSEYMILRAYFNSILITALSIILLLGISSAAGFVLERRKSKTASWAIFLTLVGLMIPPAVVPTIWVLKSLGLYKTLAGIVMVETALNFPFAVLLFKGYMSSIPRELDEASFMDGCTSFQLFGLVVSPLMTPVEVAIAIVTSISIFNDFVNPLYFLPGAKNVTVQLTLYNFMSMYYTRWNLVFANMLLISIPPLLFFIFFNRKITSGLVAGAIKA